MWIYIFICTFIYLFMYYFVDLFMYLFIYLRIYLFIVFAGLVLHSMGSLGVDTALDTD